jgi:AsmA-like C-terminal region
MPSSVAPPPAPAANLKKEASPRKLRLRRTALIVFVFTAFLVCTAAVLVNRFWPFTQASVIEALEESGDSRVQIRGFHSTYFPYPGCTLDGVVFMHGTNAMPLITIEKLTIQGAYLGILAQRIRRVTAEGMRVTIPPFGSGEPFHTNPSPVIVSEIVANGATVEFASREPGKQPLRFDIHEALLHNVGWSGPLSYSVKVHNPEPPGEVTATGKFGVWDENEPEKTPITGDYKFENADLSVYGGIAGTLSSDGKFGGALGHVDISGKTDTPDFEVKSGGRAVRLTTEFSAYVDAIHGDTFLKRVDAHFRKTHVLASGSISGSEDRKGKTALIDLSATDGRLEDMIGLFVQTTPPPMSGTVNLRARAELPSGKQTFLEKLKVAGTFGIGRGEFSEPSTQEGLNKLSAGAQGEKDPADPATVLTDLAGHVKLSNGVASFSDLSFGVPGATARMQGTYSLLNYKIDMHGQMQVDTKISNTTNGAKALLLKMMDPFFKKRKKGEILPVRISGTYQHPSFGLDLEDKKAQRVLQPSHTPNAR